jgi:dTDP-4-dehydrorhamnose 3,5-epimerase
MQITEQKIQGVFEISLRPNQDERGFFMRVYDDTIFESAGINRKWVQENHSRSEQKGIIRGLHLQFSPHAETKLVRCTVGAIFDVYVDLRTGSDTFGQWSSIELSAENKKMIYIPRGFAHGFCTLTEISEVQYKVDNYYSKENEAGIAWDDPDLAIPWPTSNPILSDKDRKNMRFREFVGRYEGLRIDG